MQTENPALEKPDYNLVSNLRALPATAWILFFGTFLNKFGGFVIPFLALYLTHLGYSVTDIGLCIAAYGIGNLAASFLGGHLADTIGRRKTILLSTFCGAASLMLLSQARTFPTILSLAALTGLVNEFYRPACSALLTDLVPPNLRVTAFATYRMSFNAGWAFGPATAGFLATKGYFWLFAGDAATTVLFGLVALFALPKDGHHARRDSSWTEAFTVVRRDRSFLQISLASFFVALVFMQMSSTFGVQVTRLGFTPAIYGALISLNGVLVVLCELPLTTVTRRFPVRRVLATGYLLIGFGFALNLVARTVPQLAACVVIFTFGEMVAMPVATAFVSNLAPAHLRGRYMGMFGLNWGAALIIAPGIGLQLLAWNPAVLWAGCGVLAVIGAAVISTGFQSRQKAAASGDAIERIGTD